MAIKFLNTVAVDTDVLYVDASSNRVGIGTTSPATKLHIADVSTPTIRIEDTTNNRHLQLFHDNNNSYIRSSVSSQIRFQTNGANDRMLIDTSGNVGIGTTSPSQKLEVAGKLLVDNGNLGSVAGDTIYHAEITGQRHHLDFKEVRTANGSDWMNTTYKLQMRVDSTNHQSIDFVSDANAKEHIDIYTGNQVFNTRFDANGNVGIGTTDPQSKLHLATTGASTLTIQNTTNSGNAALNFRDEGNNDQFQIYYALGANRSYNLVNGNGLTIYSSQVSTEIARFGNASSGYTDSYFTGNVGIGTTSPNYKLDVGGGARAGGKVTYTKLAGYLDTTGYAVAGLTTSNNGNSAGFTFTCFGHGGYQKVVYSCYNASGTWNTIKVIDEGTNAFDVEASANAATITFTFKSTSGTKYYTPRVTVEATGSGINSTYA